MSNHACHAGYRVGERAKILGVEGEIKRLPQILHDILLILVLKAKRFFPGFAFVQFFEALDYCSDVLILTIQTGRKR